MYKNELRKRVEPSRNYINKSITTLFSGSYPNIYTNNSLNYYENLKRELDARKTRKRRVLFRTQLLENQEKLNYTNELDRIRGYLSTYDSKFPTLTLENLKNKVLKLKELGAKITDKNDFDKDMANVQADIDKRKKVVK